MAKNNRKEKIETLKQFEKHEEDYLHISKDLLLLLFVKFIALILIIPFSYTAYYLVYEINYINVFSELLLQFMGMVCGFITLCLISFIFVFWNND